MQQAAGYAVKQTRFFSAIEGRVGGITCSSFEIIQLFTGIICNKLQGNIMSLKG